MEIILRIMSCYVCLKQHRRIHWLLAAMEVSTAQSSYTQAEDGDYVPLSYVFARTLIYEANCLMC